MCKIYYEILLNGFLQVRVGLPAVKAYGLEEVFYKYGVDLQIYGHEHSYERIWPVYNRTVSYHYSISYI